MRAEVKLPEDREELRLLFGNHDAHLRMLRTDLGVSLVPRGVMLVIEGEDDKVGRAVNVLERMVGAVERGGEYLAEELAVLMELAIEEQSGAGAPVIRTERRRIEARTPGQVTYLNAIREKSLVFGIGPAGTGKTYLAVACAVEALRRGAVKRLVLTRPAVEAGERLGFLPGDLREKVDPYLRPIYDALEDMLSRRQLAAYADTGVIEVAPLAFMRGRTLSRCFVILDEAQNTTPGQMKMLLTRLGPQSRCVVTGDATQVDLQIQPGGASGLTHAVGLLAGVPDVAAVWLEARDIVRHELVRAIVKAYGEDEARRQKAAESEPAGTEP